MGTVRLFFYPGSTNEEHEEAYEEMCGILVAADWEQSTFSTDDDIRCVSPSNFVDLT